MTWVLFDLDDTLLRTSAIYRRAYLQFGAYIQSQGLAESAQAVKLMLKIDWANRELMGVRKERISISMFDTYTQLMMRQAHNPDPSARHLFSTFMEEVFCHRYRLVRGATRVLQECGRRGFRTVLYTRGDLELQSRKIRDAKLKPYFDRIFIVEQKSVAQLQQILVQCKIDPAEAWMIGDEILSDVQPALHLGMKVIRVWGCTQGEPVSLPADGRCTSVRHLSEVLPLLDRIGQPISKANSSNRNGASLCSS